MKTGTGARNNGNNPPARRNSYAATGREGNRTMKRVSAATDTFTDDEIQALTELGNRIAADLACNHLSDGLPCLTCRREAERNMERYLRLATYPAPSAVEPR
jgi:hypothetical protein